ncbi:MAG: hypothetical protein E6G76_01525 [Alphaproteobacteria bacterium]|nr:MAG: hypothetical protein E6G76_01525 [Alphaproteobacteria bacterium]
MQLAGPIFETEAIWQHMEILVRSLADHLESAFLVGFIQDIYDVTGKSHGTVERHAEASSANVVSDDAIFELTHLPSLSHQCRE